MIIKLERSGGFPGTSMSAEIDAKDLPPTLVGAVKKIMKGQKLSSPPKKSPPLGADFYCYKILIDDGVNRRFMEYFEYDVNEDVKKLIRYIEKISKKNSD